MNLPADWSVHFSPGSESGCVTSSVVDLFHFYPASAPVPDLTRLRLQLQLCSPPFLISYRLFIIYYKIILNLCSLIIKVGQTELEMELPFFPGPAKKREKSRNRAPQQWSATEDLYLKWVLLSL